MIFANFKDMQPGWPNRIKAFFTYYAGELLFVAALVLFFCFPGSWVGRSSFLLPVLISVVMIVVGRFYSVWLPIPLPVGNRFLTDRAPEQPVRVLPARKIRDIHLPVLVPLSAVWL